MKSCPQTDRIIKDALAGLPAKVISRLRGVPYPTVTYLIKKFTEEISPTRRLRNVRNRDQLELDL